MPTPSPLCLDPHVDIPSFYATEKFSADDPRLNASLTHREAGGHHATILAAYVPQLARTTENYDSVWKLALSKLTATDRLTSSLSPDRVGKATSAKDFIEIVTSGKLAVANGIENGFSIGNDLTKLEKLKQQGILYFGFVHNGHNDLCDSAIPRPALGDSNEQHSGLSLLGKEAMQELNRLGILADVSHASPAAVLDICRLSSLPVIASHTGAAALASTPRNLNDDAIRAIADTGGVIHITALGRYLRYDQNELDECANIRKQIAARRRKKEPNISNEWIGLEYNRPENFAKLETRWPRVGLDCMMQHIEHVVELVGIDHVGISSDFDGSGGLLGWDNASETPNVTSALHKHGFTSEEISKIWSGNFLRALKESQA